MIIQCDNCKAKFRLNEDRIEGKGARVRCRKCSDYIIVMKPEYEHLKSEFIEAIHDEKIKKGLPEKAEPPKTEEPKKEAVSPIVRQEAPEVEEEREAPPPTAREEAPEVEEEREVPPPTAREEAPEVVEEREVPPPTAREEAPEVVEGWEVPPSLGAEEEPEDTREEEVSESVSEPEEMIDEAWAGIRTHEEEKQEVVAEKGEPEISDEKEPEDEPEKDDIDLAFEKFLGSLRADAKISLDSLEQTDYSPDKKVEPIEGEGEKKEEEEVTAPGEAEKEEDVLGKEKETDILSASETLEFISQEGAPGTREDAYELKLGDEKLDFQDSLDLSESIRSLPDEERDQERDGGAIEEWKEAPAETLMGMRDQIEEQRTGQDSPSELVFEAPEASPREKASPYEFVPKTIPKKKKKSKLAGFLLSLLIILILVAGAGAYLAFTKPGNALLIQYAPYVRSLFGMKGGQATSPYDITNLIGYYESNSSEGKIFIIKGDVINLSKTVASGIVLKGQLLDEGSKILEEKKVYAGNSLDNRMLKNANKRTIEESLQNKLGKNLSNIDIQPGSSVPFMIVFFDLPEKIEAYKVESVD